MKKYWGKTALLASLCLVAFGHAAADTPTLEGLTADDLLQLLVKEGVVSPEKLKELGDKIKTRERKQSDAAVEPVAAESRDKKPDVPAGVVRVPYIPTYVRDEIRDQVRVGLKEDVAKDVLAQAKTERWGIPGVTPEWVDRITFYGDMRLRVQSDRFGPSNQQFTYPNLNGVNSVGTSTPSENFTNFYNTEVNRTQYLARMRLGFNAAITQTVKVGARLVTGNQTQPGKADQTIGTYSAKYPTDFDLAYISYRSIEKSLYLAGGRIENPFLSTDLFWHPDLTFEGFAASWWMFRSEDLTDEFTQFDPFVTLGAFPLQEISETSQDKWLLAVQTGFTFTTIGQSKLGLALAYYDYENTRGRLNQDDNAPNALNYTAPNFFQKGNTVFNIADTLLDPSAARYALAANYRLANALLSYDYAGFSPLHVVATADYVKNIGYNQKSVSELVGEDVPAQTRGYQFKFAVGWPNIQKRYDWQVSLAYKYLERDAAIDAFTDTVFHAGGTDGKGYILRFDYGLTDNVALALRWFNTDEISGRMYGYPISNGSGQRTPLAVDTLLLDLNAKF